MPKQRQVTTVGDGSFLSIRATIALHYLKIYKDGDRTAKGLIYQLPDDAFATSYNTETTGAGDIIERIGHGRSGALGIPPGFIAVNTPALGTELMRIKAADGSSITLDVYESENEL